MNLAILWYLVLGLASMAYCILDGFDLGVGALHLFARTDEQRRIFLNAIGPVWDGNEVWIVIMMGGLFAGFPNAYATIFSGFYTLLMFLIAGLMFRACAIEFRSKNESPKWRSFWDVIFSLSSILVGLCVGLLLGNMVEGVPINAGQEYVGTFADFFRPYSIIVAITAMSLFAMHGTIYLTMKTEGEAHQIVRKWINYAIVVFIFFYCVTTVATILYMPHMIEHIFRMPWTIVIPILAFLAILNIPRLVKKGKDGWAFIFSCLSIALLLILFGLGTYPTIVRSTIDPATNSLTIFNVASSETTLRILMIVVLIGLPLVLAYGFWIYRIFRGKVQLHKTSY
ncbi:MAG: cytochrome d ubiquinol oxidase subunit II [Verrucomicrobia bacterium]|nr:cytochrome d ubiquinol oxidase subunit II [Verrucomicrobiota bacterium]MBU6446311.1 cytochrome d ubiquinol oxidase subunit II [Verrucomicrobiota bacterium]MDE3048089.1 cytochrome d ubiquinol oxidase subunit II [Verrucomicrobiota bacterium]